LAGFQVITNGRFWVITEVIEYRHGSWIEKNRGGPVQMKPRVPEHSEGPWQGPTRTDVRIADPPKDYLMKFELPRQESRSGKPGFLP
jgi:predicted type IV restriction endonuclease